MLTSNLPFEEWTEVLGSERLTGVLLDRLPHHVHILQMNDDSFASSEAVANGTRISIPSDKPTRGDKDLFRDAPEALVTRTIPDKLRGLRNGSLSLRHSSLLLFRPYKAVQRLRVRP